MKVYCVQYSAHAGKWIYDGYRSAWQDLGYELTEPEKQKISDEMLILNLIPINQTAYNEDYIMMSADSLIQGDKDLLALSNANKAFVFVQPNSYPDPWGRHGNFVTIAPNQIINEINKMDNVHYWTFANVEQKYYKKWKKPIHTVPLAFDHLNYKPEKNEKYQKFDISFVGGWANNGFDEKRSIIVDIFSKFMKSGLKCGFFVNKNLTHKQECDLLANSKLTLNIHDAYQRVLGLDTNERTFKSLGLNGLMVSDKVKQLNEIFPDIATSLDSDELVSVTKEILSLTESERENMREESRQNILDNHCYTHRIQTLLNL